MTWHDQWGWGVGGYFVMLVFMVLFWGAIIALAVWAVRQFRPEGTRARGADPAMRILEERFARGEIDVDEFTRRRDALRGGSGG
ncbi:MAG: SHOCT domain-containing protein [Actinomycetota bacterium]